MNGIFKKAIIDKIITDNPCKYVDLPTFKQFRKEDNGKTIAERTLSEKTALLRKLDSSYDKRPNYVVQYAVELAMYTGMRVGESAAYKRMKGRYTELKVILTSSKVNLTELDIIKNRFGITAVIREKIPLSHRWRGIMYFRPLENITDANLQKSLYISAKT
ncbi:MAG: hypothetical protein NC416_01280 [Eubacterium sp.]|nr:hypothetical protein [Eubacterium sp.]